MKVDKKNGNVNYNDDAHVYWDNESKYISVTTLIEKYTKPFEKDFWSLYKAIERLLSADEFKMEKKQLLDTHKVNFENFESYGLDKLTILSKQQDILDEWETTNKISTDRGTSIHAELENSFYKSKKCDLKRFGLEGNFDCKKDYVNLDLENGIYPEYLVYRKSADGVLRIAGQIDLLVKQGNDIYIFDWKGLPLDTPIATKTGWTTIKEINIGDEIFDKDGNITKVVHKSEVHYNPCYKIKFDDNEEIIADHEHKWLISFRRSDKSFVDKIMTTEEISSWLKTKKRNSYNIPKILNSKPLNLPVTDLPIDPYVFGCWLGDGSKSCGILTNVNPNVWAEIKRRGYSFGENLSGENRAEMRTIYDIRGKLVKLEVLNNKFIPDIYMRASYEQRLDLLRGFMDTDGYYHGKRKRFVMGTTQKWQADDLHKLVSTLGIKSITFPVIKKCNGKEFQAWDVCFSTNELNPFLVRNQEIEFPKTDKNSFRNIVSVELVDTVPTQCLEVDSKSHTFLFGHSMIVTHNTNKELKTKSFFNSATRKNQTMNYPLNNLMDCNMMHYSLQLSTYAWMIQQMNPDFIIKKLTIIHYDHSGGVTNHNIEYLKDDVERMLKDYKKTVYKATQEKKRAKIDY